MAPMWKSSSHIGRMSRCMDLKNESVQQKIWGIITALERLLCLMPHTMALACGAFLGRMLHVLSRKKVDAAEARCVRALGLGVTPARRVVRDSYGNLGRSVAEFLRFPRLDDDLEKFVTIHGQSNLEEALEKGRGVILLTAHFGNWEMAAATLSRRGFPVNAIGAEQRDPRITDRIIALRRCFAVKTISKGFDLKAAIRCLQRGEILGVLLDQDPKHRGMTVPFLGLPASTPYGPVKLAHKLGAAVVPLFIVRRKDGKHHDLYLLSALEGEGGQHFGSDLERDVTRCNDLISQWIRCHPEHWLWLYPRWSSTLGD